MKQIQAVLIDVLNETAGPVSLEPTLISYYKLLHCDTIDIVSRRIGGREFSIICDDEGLFKNPQKISAVDDAYQPQLVGSLLVVQMDEEGETAGLTDQEIDHVMRYVQTLYTRNYPQGYPALTQTEVAA